MTDRYGRSIGAEDLARGLRFEQLERGSQSYAGLLLERKQARKSYLERFSVDEIMQRNLGQTAVGGFDSRFNTELQFFSRFDNVVIPDVTVNTWHGVVVNRPWEPAQDEFEF